MRRSTIILGAILFILVHLCAAPPPVAADSAGYLYWTVSDSDGVWRSLADGSFAERLVSPNDLRAFAVDLVGGKVYYNLDSTVVMRANLDGSDRELIAAGTGWADKIKLDPAAGKIYWSEPYNQRIRRADLDGGNAETLVDGLVAFNNGPLALDLLNGQMYFVVDEVLKSALLDGSGVTTILAGLGPNTAAIAIDPVNQKIYLSDLDQAMGVRWCDFNGSNLQTLVTDAQVREIEVHASNVYYGHFVSGNVFVMDLDGSNQQQLTSNVTVGDDFELDLSQGHLYSNQPHLIRTDFDGSNLVPMVPKFDGYPHDVAFDPIGETVYFSDVQEKSIYSSSLDGFTQLVLHDAVSLDEARGMAIDPAAGHLYWVNTEASAVGGGLWRVGTDGQGATEIVSALGYPHDLAVDVGGGTLYWTENISDGSGMTAAIRSSNLNGSSVTVIHSGLSEGVRGLTVDPAGGKMYWTDHVADEIRRSNLDGGGVETILSGLTNPHDVAIGAGMLYWTEGIGPDGDPTGLIRRSNLDGSSPETISSGLSDQIRDLIYVEHRAIHIFADGFESGDMTRWSVSVP